MTPETKTKIKDALATIGGIILVAMIFLGPLLAEWWSCGERFPHAQFACFISGK